MSDVYHQVSLRYAIIYIVYVHSNLMVTSEILTLQVPSWSSVHTMHNNTQDTDLVVTSGNISTS